MAPGHPIAPALVELRRDHGARDVGLDPLREAAAAELVGDGSADAGALQPMSERTRSDIAGSNLEERRRDHADYVGADRARDWDHDTWQVDPVRMLEVYPHLAAANTDWERAAAG